ncbi:hypothetical protein F4604DRAFT_1696538 [Suillus subluteus]|nr:hypothetical protein F4604DRAFT_1696538 [Suillus subluteus]
MKSHKRVKSTPDVKSSLVVESEDDDDAIIKPISSGVLEVVLPWSSTIILTAGGRLEVPETSSSHPTPASNPSAIPTFDITIPGPDVPGRPSTHGCHRTTPAIIAPKRIGPAKVVWTRGQALPVCLASAVLPRSSNVNLHPWDPRPHTLAVESRPWTHTLDVPMPDLHSMAIAIQDGAARIALLEARVREQDDKIDTLQCLHESLQHKVINQHPSFPLPDSPAPATFLLDQSITPSMSPLPSALPNLINLDMGVMEPSSLKVEDASDMVGLIFGPSPVQPDGPQLSSKIEDPDDPGNLVPEYNSVSEEMDVEVKDETSGGEVDMAT